jgi:hypothetical protein
MDRETALRDEVRQLREQLAARSTALNEAFNVIATGQHLPAPSAAALLAAPPRHFLPHHADPAAGHHHHGHGYGQHHYGGGGGGGGEGSAWLVKEKAALNLRVAELEAVVAAQQQRSRLGLVS